MGGLFYLTCFSEFFQDDYLKATGGWVGFFIWRFLWILPRRLSSTFFLIFVHWITYTNMFLKQLAGGWAFLCDVFFLILPKWLSKGNWRVSVLFYLTFFSEFFEDDYLKAIGGWVGFFMWHFLECPHDHNTSIVFCKRNWRVVGIFYLTLFLKSSKTII